MNTKVSGKGKPCGQKVIPCLSYEVVGWGFIIVLNLKCGATVMALNQGMRCGNESVYDVWRILLLSNMKTQDKTYSIIPLLFVLLLSVSACATAEKSDRFR